MNDHDPASALRAVTSGIFDTVQIIYNIFDQAPEAELFPACIEHGVGVLARVPFDEGGLTGAITPRSEFPRATSATSTSSGDRKRQVYERVEALTALLGGEATTLPELALRFCLSHDAVSTVIPGMRRVSGSRPERRRRRRPPLVAGALLEELGRHAWPRNFYS